MRWGCRRPSGRGRRSHLSGAAGLAVGDRHEGGARLRFCGLYPRTLNRCPRPRPWSYCRAFPPSRRLALRGYDARRGRHPDYRSRAFRAAQGAWSPGTALAAAGSLPNVLRLVVTAPDPARREKLSLLECNIDDMSPEFYPHLLGRLLTSGAKNAWIAPLVMKKGRPGILVRGCLKRHH